MIVRTDLNATHDPAAKSWVASANSPASDFPIQNLPFAVFRRRESVECYRGGVAIGAEILDLKALAACAAFEGEAAEALAAAGRPTLNSLMRQDPRHWSALRAALFEILLDGAALERAVRGCLVPQAEAQYALPADIGDYTDFYASIHHATAVGRLFRPDNPLLPNYRWMPIAYHGRSSSIGVSEQAFHRPAGQFLAAGQQAPTFAPSRRLDYELEVGIFIGAGNPQGASIPVERAERSIFGLCLLNDWSARDLQAWESQPLGPFLGKNFATTISPWIVTLEALAPFRAPLTRAQADPPLLPYLDGDSIRAAGALQIELAVELESAKMRALHLAPQRLSRSNFRHAYWTIAQMVAHHTAGGCNLRPGDLLGSGTQSGPAPAEAGSLLELTEGGKKEFSLTSGETRTFLQDGDRVIMRGWCERAGFARIGFGACAGTVLPPRPADSGDTC